MKSVIPKVQWRALLPGQISQLCVADASTGAIDVVLESRDQVIEAPNWTPDGSTLIVNSAGRLFRVELFSPALKPIETGWLTDNNNDHLVSRDGQRIFTSSEGGGHIYALPIGGGEPRQVSPDREGTFSYFLQGLSPDGTRLSCAGRGGFAEGPYTELYDFPVDGPLHHEARRMTGWKNETVGFEYLPDGSWYYFNSEIRACRPGDAQIFRMRPDGSDLEQLTEDDNVNWFPKVSPDGHSVVHLSFPRGSLGHPANVPTDVGIMAPDGSGRRKLFTIFGGQGTLNVNSWAPDSKRFAFVQYPVREPTHT
jgi:TolB protein